MITEQVVTYIKEQLTRGIARDKIRANLLAAGWLEEDVNQAFSFAQPNTQVADLKIAPTFAAQDKIYIEKPIDKSEILKKDEPLMPILKRDSVSAENPVKTVGNPVENINSLNPVTTSPVVSNIPVEFAVKPIVSPVINSTISPAVNPVASLGVNPIVNPYPEVFVTNQFPSENKPYQPPVRKEFKATKSGSGLKVIALLLVIILIGANVYLWIFLFPKIDQANMNSQNKIQAQNEIPTDQTTRDLNTQVVDTLPNTDTKAPFDPLLLPANKLQMAASNYFAKYNSYGGVSMPMGSCRAAATVFVDPIFKAALSEMSTIDTNVPQCALIGDDKPNKKIRTIGYVVYIPIGDAGYCIDNTGAAIAVTSIPTGKTCTSGL